VHRIGRQLACVVALALCAASCSVGETRRVEKGTTSPPEGGSNRAAASTIEWQQCGDVECATLRVALAPDDPQRGRIDLALVRHRATGSRIGALLTNPGGPGAASLWIAQQASDIFPDTVLEHFDVIAWDPRGTGKSTAVRCGEKLDGFWSQDHSPDTEREVQSNVAAAKRLANECEATNGRLLPYLSSRSTVADMDAIRRALGDDKISYLGFSYGTYLGALYADTYPTHVRAMVLDGAVDPSLSSEAATAQQAEGFDRALDAFLTDCEQRSNCTFKGGGNPKSAYDRLMRGIDAEPLFATIDGEERELGPGEADVGVAEALYGGREAWPGLATALADAARGNGSKLLELSDQYTDRRKGGTYTSQTAAFYAIGCLDAPAPATLDDVERVAREAERRAPEFGASTTWLGLPCTYWPVQSPFTPEPLHAAGAPPILVLGTTHDPATPFEWARALAAQLDSGHLVALDDEGHAAYGRGNECIDDIVHAYLLHLTVPRDGIQC
jgi:pimeloyl-ACP methyl ester carboxylesterase